MRVFVQPALLTATFVYKPKPLTITIWFLDDAHREKLFVQLWSDLNDSRWTEKDFKELDDDKSLKVVGYNDKNSCRTFEVVVPTDNVDEGWHEFTIRYKMEGSEKWQWISENQNGRIFVGKVTQDIKHGIERISSIFYQRIEDKRINYVLQDDVDCWYVSSDARFNSGQPTCVNFGNLQNVVQFFAIRRSTVWWTIPVTGTSKLDIQDMDAFYILAQQSTGFYVVMIPMITDECTSSFRTDKDGNLKLITINDGGNDGIAKFVIGYGKDPYIVSRSCIELIKATLGTGGKSGENTSQQFYYDYLGYCTWNAFHKNVHDQDVMDALQSLDEIGVHVGYVILDDGWQQFNDRDQLESFEPNPKKFPDGLKGLICKLKERFQYVRHFGVWHTLWGYWNGIDPFSKISSIYEVEQVKKGDQLIYLITPKDIQRFYHDFHGYLKKEGVSMLKVDSQGSFDLICNGETRHRQWWKEYQAALKKSCKDNFENRVIYCMAHSPKIMQWVLSGPGTENSENTSRPLFRNTDDYFPDVEDSHAWHIYSNAMNNVLTSMMYSLPDWDMFQSSHRFNEFHAAARAISGSPMYITDPPHKHNVEILTKCIINIPTSAPLKLTKPSPTPLKSSKIKLSTKLPQRILRSESPALPSLSNLFQDSTKVDKLLKIYNKNKRIGVIGLWNCRQYALVDQICLDDTHDLEFLRINENDGSNRHYKCATYFFQNKETCVIDLLGLDKRIPVMIQPGSFEIVTVSPIDVAAGQKSNGDEFGIMIACFGLIDKYNGSRAVHSTKFQNQRGKLLYEVRLIGYGECGFHLDARNGFVTKIKACLGDEVLNDEKVMYDREKKFLTIRMDREDMEKDGRRNETTKLDDDALTVNLILELIVQ
ncbi:16054_t:CDS:2 [Acaulospora morrowiae]|uniref:16054_t:CDS:1 n=1 Tax=Acaulospora morrowiae TaxID=94023 RepID=A0A9N9AGP5_9GLOM|nr:16054_t:CDS:2 [Acaulospora morrowiae]